MKNRFSPVALLLLCSGVLLLSSGSASANPIPYGYIFIHVQPYEPEPPVITTCEQIVQYTSAEGLLEFDIFIKSFAEEPPFGIFGLVTELVWPPDWTFVDCEILGSCSDTILVDGNHADVCLAWPDCYTTDYEVIQLLRCIMFVSGPGSLALADASGTVHFCTDNYIEQIPSSEGMAGVVCDWCYDDCDYGYVCRLWSTTPLLELDLVQGETASEELIFHVSFYPDLPPCSVDFSGTEAWMSVAGQPLDEYNYQVTLDVDTAGLTPGVYTGWVRGASDCVACTQVRLEVLSASAVPDEAPRASWSQVKAFY